MDVAQLLTTSVSKSSGLQNSSGSSASKTSATFNDYLNSFLEAANEVKNTRSNQTATSSVSVSKVGIASVSETKFSGVKANKTDENPDDTGSGTEFALNSMTPEEQEAFERIAILVSDGSLDSEAMAELSEDELEEIVEWVLAGASGLFAPYNIEDDSVRMSGTVETDLFGLEDGAKALSQLEEVYNKIGNTDLSESDMAVIGELLDMQELDSVEIDRLAQAILEIADEYSAAEAGDSDTGEEMNLRELLKNVPEEELVAKIEGVLSEFEVDVELPEIPEAVLKSLCIEVVNVNNKMLDAAELNAKLLDGLNNNNELREKILSSISDLKTSDELMNTVTEDAGINNSEVIDDLAEAVLEDSTSEELVDVDSEIAELTVKAETPVVADEIEAAAQESESQIPELKHPALNDSSILGQNAENESKTVDNIIKTIDPEQKSVQELAGDNEVKITVNKSDEINTTEEAVRDAKDTGKDLLTGRAYSGDNSANSDSDSTEEETPDKKSLKQEGKITLQEGVTIEESSESAFKSAFGDTLLEVETKTDVKITVPETPLQSYTSDNPYVKYAEMIENLDRLSKLMVNNADKAMKSVTMELSPPELGKLTIEVSVKDGQANASIKVETDGAKQMLLNNLEQLKRNLESHGIKLENFEVELDRQQEQSQEEHNAFARAQQDAENRSSKRRQNGTKAVGSDGNEDEENKTETRRNVVGEDGSVDIVA